MSGEKSELDEPDRGDDDEYEGDEEEAEWGDEQVERAGTLKSVHHAKLPITGSVAIVRRSGASFLLIKDLTDDLPPADSLHVYVAWGKPKKKPVREPPSLRSVQDTIIDFMCTIISFVLSVHPLRSYGRTGRVESDRQSAFAPG